MYKRRVEDSGMRLVFFCVLLRTTFGNYETNHCGQGVDPEQVPAHKVREGDFPWLLSLQRFNSDTGEYEHDCSATLLSCNWAITAAHCIQDAEYDVDVVRLVAGVSNSLVDTTGAQILIPKEIIVHPKFKLSKQLEIDTYRNDVALIKLATPADLSQSNVGTICLPRPGGCEEDKVKCFVTGWGSAFKTRNKAQKAAVELVDDVTCNDAWGKIRVNKKSTVCLESETGNLKVQDSGSALQCVNDEGSYELFGVMSYAPRVNKLSSIPSVYADTASVLRWIQKHAEPDDKCIGTSSPTTEATTQLPPTTETTTQLPLTTETITELPRTRSPQSICKDPLSGVDGGVADDLFFSIRVINGNDAAPGKYPWQLGLQSIGRTHPFCAATLVSCKYAVTACHCVQTNRINISRIEVVAGATDLGSLSEMRQYRKVKKVHFHPDCNQTVAPLDRTDDLAVLELDREFLLTDTVRTIRLPDPYTDFSNRTCKITGWGFTDMNPKVTIRPDKLQEATVDVWSRDRCEQVLNTETPRRFDDSHICISGAGSCFGDSGGPLQCVKHNKWYLVGVSSFTFSVQDTFPNGTVVTMRCYQNLPSGYTNVPRAVDWIRKVTRIQH